MRKVNIVAVLLLLGTNSGIKLKYADGISDQEGEDVALAF